MEEKKQKATKGHAELDPWPTKALKDKASKAGASKHGVVAPSRVLIPEKAVPHRRRGRKGKPFNDPVPDENLIREVKISKLSPEQMQQYKVTGIDIRVVIKALASRFPDIKFSTHKATAYDATVPTPVVSVWLMGKDQRFRPRSRDVKNAKGVCVRPNDVAVSSFPKVISFIQENFGDYDIEIFGNNQFLTMRRKE